MISIFIFIISYLLGSFPTAYFVVKKETGKDITKEETGNVGAMNTARVTGKLHLFLIVMLGDALKGYIAVMLPIWLGMDNILWFQTVAALGAILGHCYSLYFKIKDGKFAGGKALSTAAGILLAINFTHILLPAAVVMGITILLIKNLFGSQFFSALSIPIFTLLFDPQHIWLSLVITIPILIKQSPRIIPFFQGKEPQMYFKRKNEII